MIAVQAPNSGRRLTLDELVHRLDAAHLAHETAANAKRRRYGPPRARRYPLSELYRAVGALSLTEVASRTGVHVRLLSGWHRQGSVTVDGADRLAIGLGLHPAEVWSDWLVDEEVPR